jgi:nicotinate-nucleotide pyrophosphorylase (carboxylating)
MNPPSGSVTFESALRAAVQAALLEDRARDDVTTRALGSAGDRQAEARFISEERMVVAGLRVLSATFQKLEPSVIVEALADEGEWIEAGQALAVARGTAATLLAGERVALNFLQRLSGIASATRRIADRIAGTGARVTHTRKTTPGLRVLELYAVVVGGGVLNRISLADQVLWKDNHWSLLEDPDGLGPSLESVAPGIPIAVEVESEAQLRVALRAGVTHLLVDNQPPARLAAWARQAGPGVTIQASGGIGEGNARDYAEAGAHLLAIGALTHSVRAAGIRCDIASLQDLTGR